MSTATTTSTTPSPNRRTHRASVDARSVPSALARLAASRERLRSELMQIAYPPRRPSLVSRGSLSSALRSWAARVPGAISAIDAVEGWWDDHPARQAAIDAARACDPLIQPVARRYPRQLLISSFVAGAAMILVRPWRWLLRPGVIFSMVTSVVIHRLRQAPR